MAAGLPRIQFQTPLIHFAKQEPFFQSISLLHLSWQSSRALPLSHAVNGRRRRETETAAVGRAAALGDFLFRQRQFHRSWWLPSTFSRVMRHGLYLATQREALYAHAQSQDCSSHIPRPLVFRARPNECAFFETADSEYSIYRPVSVEKVLFWLRHMERHALVLVLPSEDLSYIRLCTFSIAIWWRLHIENFVKDSRFILVDIWNCSTINSSTWQQRASSLHGKVGRPHRKYSSYNKLT